MYRQYENPWTLEDELRELQARIAETTDEDELIALSEQEAELRDRINYAWQDDEYDSDYDY